jgi:hypothetical protein
MNTTRFVDRDDCDLRDVIPHKINMLTKGRASSKFEDRRNKL